MNPTGNAAIGTTAGQVDFQDAGTGKGSGRMPDPLRHPAFLRGQNGSSR